jgi:hypothetical protein
MRKLIIMCTVFLITSLPSCGIEEEKISIIKGSGSANSSLMVSFNELCAGEVEGFLGRGDQILVSRASDGVYVLSAVDAASKEEDVLITVKNEQGCTPEISQDGKKFLLNNILIDIETKESKVFPAVEEVMLRNPDGIPHPPSYSFIGSSEVALTDPFFYIMKYYFTITEAGSINANKTESEIKEGFSKIQRPDIDYIISPKLIPEDLLYVFIGYRNSTQVRYLYVLDLYEKEFKLLNENVKTYRLSPDKKKIAYIRTNKGTSGSDTLITINTDGTDKKELVQMPHIAGLEWSHSGGWIALSAGEKGGCDISIIKSDGTHKEQLTHGMNPSDKLSWSYTGDKIAFTSGEGKPSPEYRVYIIKLNIEDTSRIARNEPRSFERGKMSKLLIETLRKETDTLINQSKKDS